MTKIELIDKLCAYAKNNMASKANSKMTQFVLGAMSNGIGRSMVESKLSPIIDMCKDSNGNLRWDEMKSSIISGFNISKTIPVLGGIISIDMNDANDFFAFVESNTTNTNSCSQTSNINT